jgi:ABC-type transport system substrate-binding protein
MREKNFHLYIGHYVTGSDPTFLSNWNWRYYWHPGKPNNYDGINNPGFNDASDGVRYAQTVSDAISSCFLAQKVFAQNALSVPLFSVFGYKAMSRRYVGSEAPYTGNYWEGVVNIQGYGIDNYWSFLNMHPQGYMLGDGSMTIRWGLSTPSIDSLNPLTANTEEAWKILDLIYEPLIRRDPYTFELIPWLAESFMPGTYVHPTYGECTKIAFTIQPEAYWSDGTPITTYDVYFTLVELPRILRDRSLMVWTKYTWFEIWEDIIDFTLLDPYNFEVLFNCKSIWAVNWISEIPILPAHIWKPIAKSGDPTSFAPDPNVIGSGPWRFVDYSDWEVFLVANKPGSTVKTNLPRSTPVTSPGYFRYYPIEPGGYFFESSPQTKKHKIPPSSGRIAKAFKSLVQKFKDILGDWLPNVDIEVYLYVNGELNYHMTFTLGDWTQLPEIAYTIYREFEAGLTRVKIEAYATFYYDTPFGRLTLLNHEKFSDPTILWFTIYEDIVGSNFYDDMNYTAYPYKNYLPTPDFKVDIKDVAGASKAFGTYPGHSYWNPVADINGDYKVDIKDVAAISKKFGWKG